MQIRDDDIVASPSSPQPRLAAGGLRHVRDSSASGVFNEPAFTAWLWHRATLDIALFVCPELGRVAYCLRSFTAVRPH